MWRIFVWKNWTKKKDASRSAGLKENNCPRCGSPMVPLLSSAMGGFVCYPFFLPGSQIGFRCPDAHCGYREELPL